MLQKKVRKDVYSEDSGVCCRFKMSTVLDFRTQSRWREFQY
jgi:hypothetical protein